MSQISSGVKTRRVKYRYLQDFLILLNNMHLKIRLCMLAICNTLSEAIDSIELAMWHHLKKKLDNVLTGLTT